MRVVFSCIDSRRQHNSATGTDSLAYTYTWKNCLVYFIDVYIICDTGSIKIYFHILCYAVFMCVLFLTKLLLAHSIWMGKQYP